MTYTPGPWTTDDRPGYAARTIYSPHRRIALMLYDSGSEDPEVDANAALVAAAPELLEACKAALFELEHARSVADAVYDGCDAAAQDMLNDMLPEEPNSKILALRAAIAKAEAA